MTQIHLHIQQVHDGPIQQGSYGYVQPPLGGGADYSSLQVDAGLPMYQPLKAPWPQPRTPQGLWLTAANANNHQLTWGVLAAAIHALLVLMGVEHWWGAATSTVYDGDNAVGVLELELGVPPGEVGRSRTGDEPEISGSDNDGQDTSSPTGGPN